MKMFNRISLRMRITLLTGILILVVSLILTYASMYNAGAQLYSLSNQLTQAKKVEEGGIAASVISTPAATLESSQITGVSITPNETAMMDVMIPASLTVEVKKSFSYWSVVYMVLVAGAGMAAAWFLAGRALAPVKRLELALEAIGEDDLTTRIAENGAVDEIGALTKSFNRMMERLEQSFERQKQFSSNVAHELKTPLATLKMTLQISRMEQKTEERALNQEKDGAMPQELLDVAERNVERLIHIVDELMLLTNEGILRMEDSIELGEMLKKITEELQPLYEGKKLLVSCNLPEHPCNVKGELGLVRRMFCNLIENAMKYNKENGEVKISVCSEEGVVKVVITDSGQGISEEDMERIFEPFYCVDPSRSRKLGGAGLGLAIAKETAERHGWKLSAESLQGQGSTFTVCIPQRRE